MQHERRDGFCAPVSVLHLIIRQKAPEAGPICSSCDCRAAAAQRGSRKKGGGGGKWKVESAKEPRGEGEEKGRIARKVQRRLENAGVCRSFHGPSSPSFPPWPAALSWCRLLVVRETAVLNGGDDLLALCTFASFAPFCTFLSLSLPVLPQFYFTFDRPLCQAPFRLQLFFTFSCPPYLCSPAGCPISSCPNKR